MRSPLVKKWIYWTPRILGILLTTFLALMSLDVFTPGLTFGQMMAALLMHNIPTIIMLIVLIVAWKHEIVGGVAFILAGLWYIIAVFSNPFEWYYLAWAIQLAGPAIFAGVLFLIGWFKKIQPPATP